MRSIASLLGMKIAEIPTEKLLAILVATERDAGVNSAGAAAIRRELNKRSQAARLDEPREVALAPR